MKSLKYFAAIGFAALTIAGCKKDEKDVSRVADVSRPSVTFAGQTITGDVNSTDNYYLETISGDQTVFITLPVGANVSLTPIAYDSLTQQQLDVEVIRDGGLNTAVPGLYVYDFRTKLNSNGLGTRVRFYIGVSNVSSSFDLSGLYRGVIGNSTDTLDDISVDPLDRAMYLISDPVADRSQIGAVFVQTSDTSIAIGLQPTDLGAQSYGDISGSNGRVQTATGDTVITYRLNNAVINGSYPASTTFTLIKE